MAPSPTVLARPFEDPLARVLDLDAGTSTLGSWIGFTSGGTAIFVGLAALAVVAGWRIAIAPGGGPAQEVEIVQDAPLPPLAPPQEERSAAPVEPRRAAATPPPALAQAAKVLSAEPRADDPVDLTNTFVQGDGDRYPGGVTAPTGTSTTRVDHVPPPGATGHGAGPLPATPAVEEPDRSRTAALSGGTDWSCPFPSEADTSQVDDAYVTLQVDVDESGRPSAVSVLSDPGAGFGREARRCALAKHYATALDRRGGAVAGRTRPFRVHFSR